MKLFEKLQKVQSELKAPKGQLNKFGGYNYRSCEDILEAVKPLLQKNGLALVISDDVVIQGERYYIRANVRLIDAEEGDDFEVTAYAREAENKKGMDESQITGAASSYARKYALNGLFSIDDTKDADATNEHGKKAEEDAARQPEDTNQPDPPAKKEDKPVGVREMRLMNLRTVAENNGGELTQKDMVFIGEEIKALGKSKIEELSREEFQDIVALYKQRLIAPKGA